MALPSISNFKRYATFLKLYTHGVLSWAALLFIYSIEIALVPLFSTVTKQVSPIYSFVIVVNFYQLKNEVK